MITAPNTRPRREKRRERHVHLGKRLEVLELIHSGRISTEAAASLMGVSIQEVQRWQALHSTDQIISLGRQPEASLEERDLIARRRRLMRLLRMIDTNLRELHGRLVAMSRIAPGAAD